MKKMSSREKSRDLKLSPYLKFMITAGLCVIIIFAASFYEPFCDRYAALIYPHIADFMGHLTANIPFPAGEIIMYATALGVILIPVSAAGLLFFGKNKKYVKKCLYFYKIILAVFMTALLIYGLNWFIVLRSSLLGHGSRIEREYTTEDLENVRNYFVKEINETAEILERDENGELILPSKGEINEKTFLALNGISGEFERLSGYYPPIKPAFCSQILHAMDIGGYTYPYTMEVTYNDYVTDIYYPSLLSHEECHHKGYYRENEAVFLGCLSLMKSEDSFLRYSGFITAYGYMNKAFCDAVNSSYPKEEAKKIISDAPRLSKRVREDLDTAKKTADQKYEKEKNVPQNVLDSAKDASDTGWDTQAKVLDKDSYDGAVWLFLDYYLVKNNT